MAPGEISSTPMSGGRYYQQVSNQRGFQVSSAPPTFGWVEDATAYPFPPPFDARHAFNETPPNVLTPLSATFANTAQPASVSSTIGVHLPPLHDFSPADGGQSAQSQEQTMRPPTNPPNSRRRTPAVTLSQGDWREHYDVLKRLWVDEDKPLNETMAIMAERFQFKPSMEQYKKQFKRWGWSKNLGADQGNWMRGKAEKRKREEKKDTIFKYRGQVHTMESLQQRFKGKKKQLEETILAADAPTPAGMKYSTPRNDPPPPPSTESPPTSSHQDRWTPAPTPHVRRPHQLVLIWDGRTKADFEALYEEAQAQERLGIVEDAEKMFREALAGFENLLSATHEDTNAAAYRLALFYARNDRMKDADRVLDWVTRNHIESFGIEHQKTVDHLFNVVDMFHDWSRTEDAITFLSRIIDACQGLVHGTTGNSNGSKAPNTRTPPSQLLPLDRLMPTTEDSEPTVTDHQISIATARAKANDEMAEPILLRLIEQCERQPKHLARQILQCRSALLGLYSAQGGISMNEALDQAQEAFWKALDSQQEKTESFFEASTELAKWYARAGRHKTADDMFIRIQSDAVESFGADSRRTITILERIGLFYQKDGMWDEAEPWFEQALAACYTTLGENSSYTKNLEIALENQYYEIYRPSQEELESDLVRRHHY